MICNSLCLCVCEIHSQKISKSLGSGDLAHELPSRHSLFQHYSDSSLKPSSRHLLQGTADSTYAWHRGPGKGKALGSFKTGSRHLSLLKCQSDLEVEGL